MRWCGEVVDHRLFQCFWKGELVGVGLGPEYHQHLTTQAHTTKSVSIKIASNIHFSTSFFLSNSSHVQSYLQLSQMDSFCFLLPCLAGLNDAPLSILFECRHGIQDKRWASVGVQCICAFVTSKFDFASSNLCLRSFSCSWKVNFVSECAFVSWFEFG